VIAVHDSYRRDRAYLAAGQFLETTIELPAVPTAAGFGSILLHRAQLAVGAELVLDDVIHASAIARLFDNYRATDRSLRARLMHVAHGALAHACDTSAERIEPVHVEAAIAE
jgi:hypothetical protein